MESRSVCLRRRRSRLAARAGDHSPHLTRPLVAVRRGRPLPVDGPDPARPAHHRRARTDHRHRQRTAVMRGDLQPGIRHLPHGHHSRHVLVTRRRCLGHDRQSRPAGMHRRRRPTRATAGIRTAIAVCPWCCWSAPPCCPGRRYTIPPSRTLRAGTFRRSHRRGGPSLAFRRAERGHVPRWWPLPGCVRGRQAGWRWAAGHGWCVLGVLRANGVDEHQQAGALGVVGDGHLFGDPTAERHTDHGRRTGCLLCCRGRRRRAAAERGGRDWPRACSVRDRAAGAAPWTWGWRS